MSDRMPQARESSPVDPVSVGDAYPTFAGAGVDAGAFPIYPQASHRGCAKPHEKEMNMASNEGTGRKSALAVAARDTLMNIAGVSGVAAKDLRPAQSLIVDLGLDNAELRVLSCYQNVLSTRLSGRHPQPPGFSDSLDHRENTAFQDPSGTGLSALIAPDEMLDMMVWEVLDLTLRRALSVHLEETELIALIMDSRAQLRSPPV